MAKHKRKAAEQAKFDAGAALTGLDEMAFLQEVVAKDVASLEVKNREYGGSWRRRGGVGAFMMLARKWDRLEEQVRSKGYNVFNAIVDDQRTEGVIDDVRDLRRYLVLVEAYLIAQKAITP